MPNVVTCQNCNTQYDGSQLPPNARFQCQNCGVIVTTAPAPQPRARAQAQSQQQAAEMQQLPQQSQAHSSHIVPVAAPAQQSYGRQQQEHHMQQQPQFQQVHQQQPKQWFPALAPPLKNRGFGGPIALFIFFGAIYHWVWYYKVHNELPKRKDDWNGGQYLKRTLLPVLGGLACYVFGIVVVVVTDSPALVIPFFLLYFAGLITNMVFSIIGGIKFCSRLNEIYGAHFGNFERVNMVLFVIGIFVFPVLIVWWFQAQGAMNELSQATGGRVQMPPVQPQQSMNQPMQPYGDQGYGV